MPIPLTPISPALKAAIIARCDALAIDADFHPDDISCYILNNVSDIIDLCQWDDCPSVANLLYVLETHVEGQPTFYLNLPEIVKDQPYASEMRHDSDTNKLLFQVPSEERLIKDLLLSE
jgi:hypothetical protein